MIERSITAAVEAILLVATEPVEPGVLAQLVAEYARDERGFTIGRVAGGYRFQTEASQAPYVERFVLEGQTARLSGPALETLAIIAYKQPVSRAQVAAIRGVNVDGVVRTLLSRELITEDGTDPVTGGGLYRTTPTFLEKMGIASVDELPSLAPLLPELDSLDDFAELDDGI